MCARNLSRASSAMNLDHALAPKETTNPNLFSLPDEAIYRIFEHLGATRAYLTLRGPRQAFNLALTNTRFLLIFRSMLRYVQPFFNPRNSSTLSPEHLLSIARLAGEHLREISVPIRSSHILSDLSKVCPNLTSVRIMQGLNQELEGISDILTLKLRKLTINVASQRTLSFITSPPENLCLTDMNETCFSELTRILQNPPKELCLTFVFKKGVLRILPDLNKMIENVTEACPKMESLRVRIAPDLNWNLDILGPDMKRRINGFRMNPDNSLCKNAVLNGLLTFPIMNRVHPKAFVSLRRGHVEFGDEGRGFFARSLVLKDEYLHLPLNRLEALFVDEGSYNHRWKKLLSGLKLKYAWVRTLRQATELSLNVCLLNIRGPICDADLFHTTSLKWATKVRQLELPAPMVEMSCYELTKYFVVMKRIVDAFYGLALCIDNYKPVTLVDEVDVDLITAGRLLVASIDKCQECGSDATSLKHVVMEILGAHL